MRANIYRRLTLLVVVLLWFQNSEAVPKLDPRFTDALQGITVTSANGVTTLTSETARPFETVIEVLRVQYRINVSYEDPVYSLKDDVKYRIEQGIPRRLIPAGGKLSLTYSTDDAEKVLKQLAQIHLVPDRGAHFGLTKVGSAYVFAPTDVRDTSGVRGPNHSPLDAHITMPAKSRGRYELLTALLELTSEAAKREIVYMVGPGPDQPGSPTYQISANDEPARSVLLRSSAAMEPQQGTMAWDLLFNPESEKYFISFVSVAGPTPAATPAQTNSAPGENAVVVP